MANKNRESEITAIACYPGKSAVVIRIQNTLEAKQAFVGGHIEALFPYNSPVALVVNEEGKLNNMEPCRALLDEEGNIYDIIVGPFLICGLDDEGFISLTPEQEREYMAMFRHPQIFVMLNGEMVAIPIEEGD